jgi:hypothetical protein
MANVASPSATLEMREAQTIARMLASSPPEWRQAYARHGPALE